MPSSARIFFVANIRKTIGGIVAGEPPAIDLAAEKRLQECVDCAGWLRRNDCIRRTISAMVESRWRWQNRCFACGRSSELRGIDAEYERESAPAEAALFGERGARAIVSVKPQQVRMAFSRLQDNMESRRTQIGHVTNDGIFSIQYNGSAMIEESSCEALRETWAHSLERAARKQ